MTNTDNRNQKKVLIIGGDWPYSNCGFTNPEAIEVYDMGLSSDNEKQVEAIKKLGQRIRDYSNQQLELVVSAKFPEKVLESDQIALEIYQELSRLLPEARIEMQGLEEIIEGFGLDAEDIHALAVAISNGISVSPAPTAQGEAKAVESRKDKGSQLMGRNEFDILNDPYPAPPSTELLTGNWEQTARKAGWLPPNEITEKIIGSHQRDGDYGQ